MDKSTLLKARNTIPSQLIKEYKPERRLFFSARLHGERVKHIEMGALK